MPRLGPGREATSDPPLRRASDATASDQAKAVAATSKAVTPSRHDGGGVARALFGVFHRVRQVLTGSLSHR